jgi:hypothetical protein
MDQLSQQQLSAYIILSFLVLIICIIGLYLLYKGYVWFVNREEILII